MGWNDIFQKMKGHYKENNSKSYEGEYKKYSLGIISRKKLKSNIYKNVLKHMKDNLLVSIDIYSECFSRYNIDVIRIKP